MGRTRYVNAKEVLPFELLVQLSKAMDGKAAYFYLPPAAELIREQRPKIIKQLLGRGYSTQQVAEEMCVSMSTVWRVLRQERRKEKDRKRQAASLSSDGEFG